MYLLYIYIHSIPPCSWAAPQKKPAPLSQRLNQQNRGWRKKTKKSVVKPMVSGPRGMSIHVQKGFHLLHPTPQKTLPSHCEVPPTSHLRWVCKLDRRIMMGNQWKNPWKTHGRSMDIMEDQWEKKGKSMVTSDQLEMKCCSFCIVSKIRHAWASLSLVMSGGPRNTLSQ